jgi:hypothetical protein
LSVAPLFNDVHAFAAVPVTLSKWRVITGL